MASIEELIAAVTKTVTDLGYYTDETCHFETGEPIVRICNGPECYGHQDVAYLYVYGSPSRHVQVSQLPTVPVDHSLNEY